MDGLFFRFFFPNIVFFFLQRALVAASAAAVVDLRVTFDFFSVIKESKVSSCLKKHLLAFSRYF